MAEKMAAGGEKIVFLFLQDGHRCVKDVELMSALSFAKAKYTLREDSEKVDTTETVVVKEINYDGWVELLETCDRIVSWT